MTFAANAAASKETFFIVAQGQAANGTVSASRIYRFQVTGSGRITGYSLVRGGVLGGLSVGRVAATPDGSELAVSVTPSKAAQHSSVPEIIVNNTRTGAQAVWRNGPDVAGTIRYGVIELSLTKDGRELVFLTQPRCTKGTRRKIAGGEEVRALSPATRGGQVSSSRLIVRQASLMRLSSSYINGVVISPDGSTLTLAVVNSPGRGASSVSLLQVSAATGRKLSVVYRMRTGNGFSYRCFGAGPSGRFFLLDAGPPSGAINGWIDHGHLVRLKPAGENVISEPGRDSARSRRRGAARHRAPPPRRRTPPRHDGAVEARDPDAVRSADVPAGVCPFTIARPVMRQRWERLTFLHWPFEPAQIQRLLPNGLEADLFDGAAWVGLVPFFMHVATPGGHEAPWVSRFCETNVRTYVRDAAGRAGIWFFSLDAARAGAVAVARTTYRLPYFWSAMDISEGPGEVSYRCQRRLPGPRSATSEVSISIGERYADDELDERDHFLTARWILFSVAGTRYRTARACHDPWPLHRARARSVDDRLITAAGLPAPAGVPLVHYSPGVDVAIGRPER